MNGASQPATQPKFRKSGRDIHSIVNGIEPNHIITYKTGGSSMEQGRKYLDQDSCSAQNSRVWPQPEFCSQHAACPGQNCHIQGQNLYAEPKSKMSNTEQCSTCRVNVCSEHISCTSPRQDA